MDDLEFDTLVKRITTWDQAHLDSLLGQPAVKYAQDHEADVRRLARHMWEVFPLGSRWWRLNRALGAPLHKKNAAIKERAAAIGRGRKDGTIVVRNGRLVQSHIARSE